MLPTSHDFSLFLPLSLHLSLLLSLRARALSFLWSTAGTWSSSWRRDEGCFESTFTLPKSVSGLASFAPAILLPAVAAPRMCAEGGTLGVNFTLRTKDFG